MVTDSINKASLFGGVGTSMILATLLAHRRGARLRIITRTEPAQSANLLTVLKQHGMTLDTEVEFCFAHVNAPHSSVNVYEDELFITTSWWTTHGVLSAIAPNKVLYLLQEDERVFYPAGDDQLRCHQILSRSDIHFAINTAGLLQHLIGQGLPHLAQTARSFEPAFPPQLFEPRTAGEGSTKRLMFYARPGYLRNLFYFGLEVLDQAIARGLIDTAKWELHFVGAGIPPLTMCDGSTPMRHEYLSWQAYAELAGSMDVALSLMYTPHPSYPPLDLAASGAVVVSNRFGNKQSLSDYCENILLGDLNMASMLETLNQALQLAENQDERSRRFQARRLQPNWPAGMAEIISHFGEKPDVWA
jgi:O-antigen biosynthesis protein